MSIVMTDVPMTSRRCSEIIDELTQTYPFLRSGTLTTTDFGQPVRTLTLGQGDRKVIFSAVHHANEWITTPVLLKFAEQFAQALVDGGTLFGA